MVRFSLSSLSLFWQLLLFFVLVTILPLLIVLSWQQSQLESHLINDRSQQLWAIAQEKKHYMRLMIQSQKDAVQQSSNIPLVSHVLKQASHLVESDSLNETALKLLDDVGRSFLSAKHQDNWLLVDNRGKVLVSVNDSWMKAENLFSSDWRSLAVSRAYRQAIQENKVIVIGYQWYDPAAKMTAFIASPVFDDAGNTQGVLIVQLNKNWLEQFVLYRQGLGETGEINLGYYRADGGTASLITPRYPINAERQATALNGAKIPLEIALQGQEGMGVSFDYRGEPVLSAWLYEHELALGLVVKQDMSELIAPLHASRRLLVELMIGIFSLLFLVIWWLSNRISSPIVRIAQQVKALGNGHGCFEPLQDSQGTSKELKSLVVDVNKTAFQLEDQFDMLAIQAIRLEGKSTDLEFINRNLEQMIAERTAELKSYIDIVDQQVITSRTDIEGNIIYASSAFCRVSGHTKEELIGKNHRIVRHPDMPVEVYTELWKTITSGLIWHGEILNMAKDGSSYWVNATISPTYDYYGKPTGYMAVRENITDRKRAELLSITDEMTGLYNRRHFNNKIDILWRLAARHQKVLALVMLDVDCFKAYNDLFGHKAGDDALKAVAKVIQNAIGRSTDAAFRLGGEEMALLVMMEQDDAVTIAQYIQDSLTALAIQHPINNANGGVLTVSIGICFLDGRQCHSCTRPQSDLLYQLADKALYQAKEQGRNCIVISETTVPCHGDINKLNDKTNGENNAN